MKQVAANQSGRYKSETSSAQPHSNDNREQSLPLNSNAAFTYFVTPGKALRESSVRPLHFSLFFFLAARQTGKPPGTGSVCKRKIIGDSN